VEGVRIACISVCCVLLASVVYAEDVTVQTKPLESSSRVEVRVILGGKLLKDVKVDFYYRKIGSYHDDAAPPTFSALTNEHGIAVPPELLPGYYDVVAILDEDVSTRLWLHVIGGPKATELSMDLTDSSELYHYELTRAEKIPVRDRVLAFQGIVIDGSGASILRAKIRVMKRGSEMKTVVLRLNTDENGHFSGRIPDGLYVAFIYSQGFRTTIVPFEVTKSGSGDMRIIMEIAHR
jgi:hypothetical protein